MSHIDLSQLITAEDHAAQAAAQHGAGVKAECRRRIFAVVDAIAQVNLAAAAAADRLEAGQLETYRAGLDWVAAMRVACLPLIADPTLDPTQDAVWPAVPAGVAALAAAF